MNEANKVTGIESKKMMKAPGFEPEAWVVNKNERNTKKVVLRTHKG